MSAAGLDWNSTIRSIVMTLCVSVEFGEMSAEREFSDEVAE